MDIIKMFLKELGQEAETTRKMLSRVPDGKYDWQPHPKSMIIRQLATHIAELPGWITMGLTTDGLDFSKNPYEPVEINNTAGLLEYFEKTNTSGRASLAAAVEADLLPNWTLRNNEYIIQVYTKAEVIRVALNQTTHHRAQLGVYLRLLDIPIPGSYGPSADEHF